MNLLIKIIMLPMIIVLSGCCEYSTPYTGAACMISNMSLLAIKDNVLWGWGNNQFAQLGQPVMESSVEPVEVMDDIVRISGRTGTIAAIKNDKTLWMWGIDNGNINRHDSEVISNGVKVTIQSRPVKIMDNVCCASSNVSHTVVVKEDGSLWTWGSNEFGELGNGMTQESEYPIKIMDDVIYAVAGINCTFAVKSDNTLWGWGSNDNYQLGTIGEDLIVDTPIKIMDDVTFVDSAWNCTAVIDKENVLWVFGRTFDKSIYTEKPKKIMDKVASCSVGAFQMAVITNDDSLWMWGINNDGQLGNGDREDKSNPVKIMNNVSFVNVGFNATVITTQNNDIYTCNMNGSEQGKWTKVNL